MELGIRSAPAPCRQCSRLHPGARPQSRSSLRASTRDSDLQQMQEYSQRLGTSLSGLEDRLRADRTRQGAADQPAAVGGTGLKELNKDSFWPFLEEAADTLVVVDFFTDWCGPCKVMLPHLEQMSGELGESVKMVKFNCSKENKELGKELGIRVAPTFQLYRQSKKVAEMSGAKVDALKALIDQHK